MYFKGDISLHSRSNNPIRSEEFPIDINLFIGFSILTNGKKRSIVKFQLFKKDAAPFRIEPTNEMRDEL